MLDHLSHQILRTPRLVIAAWVLVFAVGAVAAGGLFSSLDADLDGAPSFESERVNARLDALDPGGGEVVAVVDGAQVDPAVVSQLQQRDGVEAVFTLPSDDGRATAVIVELEGGLGDGEHEELLGDVADELRAIDAPEVLVGGEELLDEEIGELAERDAQRAEMISLPIALVVMAVVFGGILAAGLPLAIALSGVTATTLALTGAAAMTDISLYAVNVTIMLGLGLGIDYGLLLVSRFREESGRGHDVATAVHRTVATAGRTVMFSGSTVAVALAGLLVFEDPTIRSLGIAGIGVVLATMAAALTLLPALLGRVGHRLRPRASASVSDGVSDHGWFARLAGLIQRRAVPVTLIVGIGLALLAVPFLGARFDAPDVKALPRSSETRQVAEAIDERFSAVTAEPVMVIADVDPDDPAVAPWLDDVSRLDDVSSAEVAAISQPGSTVVEVRADGPTNGRTAQAVVGEIRHLDASFPVLVGGDPAEIVDFRASIGDRLPLALAIVVVATFGLLFLMTGSLVVPIKAIVMNVLSLGATFGALVWVFQDGHLSGLMGFDPPGSLDLVMPVIVFLFAFGLSMDYEVFLLARIREAWLETGDNDGAVAVGLQRSGRIITSAALLIVIVFAGFAAGEIVPMKQLGLGLAIAVVVDATVVRSLLVPATMKLMGRWNWWAPRPLRRLHRRVGLEERAVPAQVSSR
ncbi:MAG: MMPL family transporter [Acidimicrobiales bacterium]